MTDVEKLIELLSSFGVEFSRDNEAKSDAVVDSDVVTLYCGSEKVGGYCGFFTEFEFDENGTFVTVGAWE